MSVLSQIMPETGFNLDREARRLTFTRRVAAPASEVFSAWTVPERIALWWDPTGQPLVSCHIDLRVGGSFSFVSRDHAEMPFAGIYREITPPRRLAFDALGAAGEVSLEEEDGHTMMTVTITCPTDEHLAGFLRAGVATGTAQTLDNLVAYVAQD